MAYDPDWPRRFEQERAVLAAVFAGGETTIEHVGSTAVPGLGAKPVIDIMVGVSRLSEAEGRIATLEAAGWEYVQKYEDQLPERRYFRKPRLGPRVYHLHCVVKADDFWVRHIAFRDYLRAHPEAAAAYYELKRELAVGWLRLSDESLTLGIRLSPPWLAAVPPPSIGPGTWTFHRKTSTVLRQSMPSISP